MGSLSSRQKFLGGPKIWTNHYFYIFIFLLLGEISPLRFSHTFVV
jgi:hypothetical protein